MLFSNDLDNGIGNMSTKSAGNMKLCGNSNSLEGKVKIQNYCDKYKNSSKWQLSGAQFLGRGSQNNRQLQCEEVHKQNNTDAFIT